jgi:hypothetical protein
MPSVQIPAGIAIDIPLLEPSSDFEAWSTTFEYIARRHHVWEYFVSKMELNESLKGIDLEDAEILHFRQAHKATDLLMGCISKVYYRQVMDCGENKNVHGAWQHLKSRFEPKCHPLIAAYNSFSAIRFDKAKGVGQFVLALSKAQKEIKAAKGDCPDSMVIAHIGKHVPRAYKGWVDKNINNVREIPQLVDLIASLVATDLNVSEKEASGAAGRKTKARFVSGYWSEDEDGKRFHQESEWEMSD